MVITGLAARRVLAILAVCPRRLCCRLEVKIPLLEVVLAMYQKVHPRLRSLHRPEAKAADIQLFGAGVCM